MAVFYPTASWAGLDASSFPSIYATTNAPEACQGVSLTLAFSLV